ncbi:MAG: LysR family transcriptional regulator [Spirosomataceae bacterium]
MLLRQLEYIIAVHKFKSFTKAADFCCVTQPTLSQQIKTLEDSLGLEIFNRGTIPVVPTPAGRIILEEASKVVEQAMHLKKIAKELVKEQQV